MGSSTNGKKHKKEKKHRRHRSRSTSDEEGVTFDLTGEEESRSSHHRHHKHKHSHKHREHTDSKERHKHRHHHHREHERERERRAYDYQYEKNREEIIAVQESDSDSSDCVEVPLGETISATTSSRSIEKQAPPPPSISKSSEYSSSQQYAREDERARRHREDYLYEREMSFRRERREERADLRERREERSDPRERREERPDPRERREERSDPRERREERSDPRERREERPDPRERREDRSDPRERREERSDPRERREERPDPREESNYSSYKEVREVPSSRYKERPQSPPSMRAPKRRSEQSGDEREPIPTKSRRMHTPPPADRFSPIPENGAGDVLSIEETNKLRAKLGLKPLEIDPQPSKPVPSSSKDAATADSKRNAGEADLSKYKDEWGEFLHKPADNLKDKAEAEKMREKLKQRKEKRLLEDRLQQIKTLGESDDEVDDVSKWVQRSKRIVDEKKEAQKRAKALEEMDAEFGVSGLVEQEKTDALRKAYSDKHLKGLRVEHDIEEFSEGRTIILTLKDKDVLDDEGGDALVNVNMIDNERYRKNVETKKQNPSAYGYNVYEEQYDQFGNPIEREILAKYDEDIDGKPNKKKDFVIGEDLEYQKEQKRKLLEIKTKLAGKRLETLADINLEMATDTFSEAEMAKFKKPKKKVRKLRQKLKADDLLPLNDDFADQHLGSRHGRHQIDPDDSEAMDIDMKPDINDIKIGEDDDDLERVLNKARRLKQKERLNKKPIPIDVEAIKQEIKAEVPDTVTDFNIVLNATAEFCRTLGDIPTYGMSGNRNVDENDRMDYEEEDERDDHVNSLDHYRHDDAPETQHGTWNSVNPEDVLRPVDLDVGGSGNGEDVEDVAILDEEPDVGAGVANALRLALSKGYLEKEERKRPSNTTMAHLQAKNYSIEDKSAGDDDKIGRRDRYHAGPIMDFKDKDNFKPNVKLEYIDDNGRILNLKEAFRYLSHKFHGKGPGKNKIEKRLKKMEQEGLMKTMSSTDTPLGTLTMLQQKQKETKTAYVVLSGGKQTPGSTSISKYK